MPELYINIYFTDDGWEGVIVEDRDVGDTTVFRSTSPNYTEVVQAIAEFLLGKVS
jgi:hypothetical protein